MSPRDLLDDEPTFVLRGSASFKHSTLQASADEAMLTALAQSLGQTILQATPGAYTPPARADKLREAILESEPFVSLGSLVSLCWATGIPIIYQEVFPLAAKRMDAMTVAVADRPVILLARRTSFPAFLAFVIAHELGHVALGHVGHDRTLADFSVSALFGEDEPGYFPRDDIEEAEANSFAFELLTGNPTFAVEADRGRFHSAQVAVAANEASQEYRVDPGTVALALGYATNEWPTVYGALKLLGLYDPDLPERINQVAIGQLEMETLTSDGAEFLARMMGR